MTIVAKATESKERWNRGGAMKLLNVSRRLNDLLVVTKLLTVFDCFDQESEALASFEPQPVSR
jgi:anti-anti-sigma regulatory factor